ncbi:hypothetical protein CYY_004263 [Polysphondylium violaceum]|uniref:Myb domain-containing protein n=1 Tax=Polysphondylium violaceum TaxID=133409 RepID=A0A8J4UT53_9MYCE|nr:hypothetical protein CYY_004263 [Polysphondylium violaceum]
MNNSIINGPITNTEEYKKLTKLLETLEQQREKVIQDKETLNKLYQDALASPIEFIENLISGKIILPKKQVIAEIPNIDLSQSKFRQTLVNNSPSSLSSPSSVRNSSPSSSLSAAHRLKIQNGNSVHSNTSNGVSKLNKSSNHHQIINSHSTPTTPTKLSKPSLSYSQSTDESSSGDDTKRSIKHTGVYTSGSESGGNNYQKKKGKKGANGEIIPYWTDEEQKQLELLLFKYPEEVVAAKRWAKIAVEMHNKTPKQIASRTQKFFQKCIRLGLPLPGSKKYRSPDSLIAKPSLKSSSSSSHSFSKLSISSSSTLNRDKSITPPSKNQNRPSTSSLPSNTSTSTTNNSTSASTNKSIIHEGFKCDGCDIEPIIGTRWKCEECMEMDLCDECRNNFEEIGNHSSSHLMTAYREVQPAYYLDDDYKFSYPDRGSNYLDSNYHP